MSNHDAWCMRYTRFNPFGTINGYIFLNEAAAEKLEGDELDRYVVHDDATSKDYPLEVHGGWTLDNEVSGGRVIGFDTLHVGDFNPKSPIPVFDMFGYLPRQWTAKDVYQELQEAVEVFAKCGIRERFTDDWQPREGVPWSQIPTPREES